MASRKQGQIVQIARRQLNLSEERYREILQKVALVESSKDLDQVGFELVMQTMAALGFRSEFTRTFYGRRQGFAHPSTVSVMRKLWAEFTGGEGNPERDLDKWLERTFKVSALRFATNEQADKAVRALRAMVGRNRPKAPPSFDARVIAQWRYRVIEAALRHPKRSRGRVAALAAIVEAEHAHPDGCRIGLSESAIRRWMTLYEQHGLEGLEPKKKGSMRRLDLGDVGGSAA